MGKYTGMYCTNAENCQQHTACSLPKLFHNIEKLQKDANRFFAGPIISVFKSTSRAKAILAELSSEFSSDSTSNSTATGGGFDAAINLLSEHQIDVKLLVATFLIALLQLLNEQYFRLFLAP